MKKRLSKTITTLIGLFAILLVPVSTLTAQQKKWVTYASGILELEQQKNILGEDFEALYFHGSLIRYRKVGPIYLGLEAHTDGVLPLEGGGILGDLWLGPSVQYRYALKKDYSVFVRGSALYHEALSDNYAFIPRWRVASGSLTPTISQSSLYYLAAGLEKKLDEKFALFVLSGYRWSDINQLIRPGQTPYTTRGLFINVGVSF